MSDKIIVKEDLQELPDYLYGMSFTEIDDLKTKYPEYSDLCIGYSLDPRIAGNKYLLRGSRLETDEELQARLDEIEAERLSAEDRRARGVDLYWIVSQEISNRDFIDGLIRQIEQLREEAKERIQTPPYLLNEPQHGGGRFGLIHQKQLNWFLPNYNDALMFAMLCDGSIKEYEWPCKVSGLDEEEIAVVFFEQIVMQYAA